MGDELTGILKGTGAKMKGEVLEDVVRFRGAVQADVPFEEIVADVRGTLLVLSFGGHVVELGAGARANQLASKVRNPPSRLDRLGIEYGVSAALAGPVPDGFRSELEQRAVVAAGVPASPVSVLFLFAAGPAALDALPKVKPLVAPGGSVWFVAAAGAVPDAGLMAAARAAGMKLATSNPVRFAAGVVARRLAP